jgi:hypothetical protein
MSKETKSYLIGRSAVTGKLTSVDRARAYPTTHVVERMPKPGNGDTKKK